MSAKQNETGPQALLDAFVDGLPPERESHVRELHAAVLAAAPPEGFDVAVKYNLLMYAIRGDWRHWVVSIDGHPKAGVSLKFLFGVMLPDPRNVLRAGSSVLMSWDFPVGSVFDRAAVESYVAEAVRLYPEYRANDKAILATARDRAKAT